MQLGLGTVQLGLNYGISNDSGQTSMDEAKRIVDFCHTCDINLFDTASAYGESEKVLGQLLPHKSERIVTKLPPCDNLTSQDITQVFQQSLTNLQVPRIYGLMLHNGADLLGPNGDQIYEQLQEFKSQQKVLKIGSSVYCPEETRAIIERYDIDIIQLPINLFDQRFALTGTLEALKTQNVEIHSRSTFLQGLLLMELDSLPGYFAPFKSHIKRYFEKRGENALVPAIQYVKQLALVDYLVVGATSVTELAQIVSAFKQECHLNFGQFGHSDERLILPTNWTL